MLQYLPKLPPENNFQNSIANAVTQTKFSTLAKAKTLFFFGEAIVWIADSDWSNLVTHTAWLRNNRWNFGFLRNPDDQNYWKV